MTIAALSSDLQAWSGLIVLLLGGVASYFGIKTQLAVIDKTLGDFITRNEKELKSIQDDYKARDTAIISNYDHRNDEANARIDRLAEIVSRNGSKN